MKRALRPRALTESIRLLPGETAADALLRVTGAQKRATRRKRNTAHPRLDAPVPHDERNLVAFVVPVVTQNEANGDQGRIYAQAKLRKLVRSTTGTVARVAMWPAPKPPLLVVITRWSAGSLDRDGLSSACKSVQDGCADWLGIDDRHEDLVRYERRQGKCARGIGWVTVEVRKAVT